MPRSPEGSDKSKSCRCPEAKCLSAIARSYNQRPNDTRLLSFAKTSSPCAYQLNPNNLGPVLHWQTGVCAASSLERFWLGSLCPKSMMTKDGPTRYYYDRRRDYFEEEHPVKTNRRINGYFVWEEDDVTHYLKRKEARQFYCGLYEDLAKQAPCYKEVEYQAKLGMLCIVDDSFDRMEPGSVSYERLVQTIEDQYLNGKTFSYKLCLFAMLTLREGDRPWNKYKTFELPSQNPDDDCW